MKPAPTDASSTSWPVFSRPDAIASVNASGIVAAVVLPNRSMLMITLPSADAVGVYMRSLISTHHDSLGPIVAVVP